jgi:hypothetical protein
MICFKNYSHAFVLQVYETGAVPLNRTWITDIQKERFQFRWPKNEESV